MTSDGTRPTFSVSDFTAGAPPTYAHLVHTYHCCRWCCADYHGNGPIGGRNVSKIIANVVKGLSANPKRRFSYVEQAYFQIWFETQTPDVQAQVKKLVAAKQLTFLNGGWSMHDEANPSYIDMLDNTAIGQRYIALNFGQEALPVVTWQIDPFGHSAFQGVLSSSLSGYFGVMWARESADFKQQCCAARNLERIWSPSSSLGTSAVTMQAIFVDAGYGTPDEANRCDYGANNGNCGAAWGAHDVKNVIDDIDRYRAPNVRGTDIFLNFGDDFTAENAVTDGNSGDLFAYIDSLIEALNSDDSGRFTAFYSSPSDYLRAKLASVPALPLMIGDSFPYADDTQGHNLWTGAYG